MVKRATNIILLLVSIGIILFIINAFYSAFTRQNPALENQTDTAVSGSTVSGNIVGTDTTPPTTSNSTEVSSADDPNNAQQAQTSAFEATTNTAEPTNIQTTDTPTANQASFSTNTHSTNNSNTPQEVAPGQVLRDNPHLRKALPAIPEAPVANTPLIPNNNFPTPISSASTSSTTTASVSNNFPMPIETTPNRSSQPSNNFPMPIGN